ncbi:MAG: hypothetical protein NC548_60965 [Lachnospiraceae bacterium]|nr:hypothetical protein [Lachnospiraceae bacterium]MCM1231107.1 hypothetical protein [Ruminococcus flavefaciens]
MKTFKVECTVSIEHKDRDWELAVNRTLRIDRIPSKEVENILNGCYWNLSDRVRAVCEKCGWKFWGINSATEIKSESAENAGGKTMYLDGFEVAEND